MLVTYSVTADALKYYDSPVAHRRAVTLFRLYGIFTYCQDLRSSKTYEAIMNLDQQSRILWQGLLQSGRSKRLPNSCEVLMSSIKNADIANAVGELNLICIDPSNGLDFSIDDQVPNTKVNSASIELCLLEHADLSFSAGRSMKLANSHVPSGQNVKNLWNERFADLAQISSGVSLIDSYSVPEFMDRTASGLRRLLLETDGSSGKKISVNILSTVPDRFGLDQVFKQFDSFAKSLSRGGIGSINLFLLDAVDFRGKLGIHDRWLRFDKFSYLSLAAGISVLEGKQTKSTHDFALKMMTDELRKSETAVRDLATQRGTSFEFRV